MTIYNIFISHAWKYSEHYKKIVQWLDEAQAEGKFRWKNYSVPEHDPLIDPNSSAGKTKLKSELNEQIRPATKVIILAGMYADYSDWIEYELTTAVCMNKCIIGVKPWGQERVAAIITNNSDTIVGWNKDSVINAILNS